MAKQTERIEAGTKAKSGNPLDWRPNEIKLLWRAVLGTVHRHPAYLELQHAHRGGSLPHKHSKREVEKYGKGGWVE